MATGAYIKDGNVYGGGGSGGGSSVVEKTMAEWEALPDTKYSDGIEYEITDWEGASGEASSSTDFILSGTLTAGETALTITDDRITEDTMIDIYTDVYGVSPTDVAVSAGEMTLTFEAQEADLNVKVRCL